MFVGGTRLLEEMKKRKDLTPAQAYLVTEVAYTPRADLPLSYTVATLATMKAAIRKGYLEWGELRLSVRLSPATREMVKAITPNLAEWTKH